MSSSIKWVLEAAIVLLACARAVEQLVQLRRSGRPTTKPRRPESGSLLAPAAGVVAIAYAHFVSGETGLAIAAWISTISGATVAFTARRMITVRTAPCRSTESAERDCA